MKISVFELDEREERAFAHLDDEHELRFERRPLDRRLAAEHADADILSTFVHSDLGAAVLDRFDDLTLIATRSTGFDHIDADWCREHDVTVVNVPTYGSNTVAEHVFALLLAISRHVVEAADRTRRGDFSQAGLRGFDLMGRTLGVVGTGDIGRHAIRIGRGFGMNVLAFDVEPDDELAQELDFEYVAMERLLAESDVVTLHVPGAEATHHLIASEQFEQMKRGAILINTSRGSVVDTKALIRALSDGTVAGAGIDVIEEEPVIREEAELLDSLFSEQHDLETLLADHMLLRLRNVVITPHSAFNTNEAVDRILETTGENIERFLAGEPQNVVRVANR